MMAGGPAAKAGVKVGDVVTAIDGKPVDDPQTLRNAVGLKNPGRALLADYARWQKK